VPGTIDREGIELFVKQLFTTRILSRFADFMNYMNF